MVELIKESLKRMSGLNPNIDNIIEHAKHLCDKSDDCHGFFHIDNESDANNIHGRWQYGQLGIGNIPVSMLSDDYTYFYSFNQGQDQCSIVSNINNSLTENSGFYVKDNLNCTRTDESVTPKRSNCSRSNCWNQLLQEPTDPEPTVYSYRGFDGIWAFKKQNDQFPDASRPDGVGSNGCMNDITIDDAKEKCYNKDDCYGFYSKKD